MNEYKINDNHSLNILDVYTIEDYLIVIGNKLGESNTTIYTFDIEKKSYN